jgi:serine/threonine protein kinase
MSINPGRIGKYEFKERIASGVVGEIWKAFDTQQRHDVAMRIIPINAQTEADFTPRFYREAEVLAALHHPNIVPVRDFRLAQSGSEAYIIMDYVEGQSFADYLNETAHKGAIPPQAEIIRLLAPVADALDYAHQRNVIHGALRPAAILLDKESTTYPAPGEPKLTDFGFNRILNPMALSLNEVPYISPEIAQGFAGTNRSDVYSLGVILYEICTGALPFNGDTPGDILMQHIHSTPTPPALINPHIPPALTAVIMRSLSRDPATRPPTAIALIASAAKALNTNMPEGVSHSRSLQGSVDSPSMSGFSGSLDTMNSPTFPSQLSQRPMPNVSSVPPVVAGSSTPVLPVTPTGSMPLAQTPDEQYIATSRLAQPPLAASASTPVPLTPTGPAVQPQVAAQVVPPPTPVQKRRPGWLYIVLAALLLLVLVGSAFGVYLHNMNSAPPPQTTIVGHAYFLSSGLLSSNSNLSSQQGITDELAINLQNLPSPQPGKLYYAWLLDANQTNLPDLALGPLPPPTHGQVTMMYQDPQHNNLLANYSHFLVTEEDASPPPITHSLDSNTWRYSAAFSTTANPADTVHHFSVLDHLRHLLAQDPKLHDVGLGGGLDIWLFRNVTKVVEQAGSARDSQKGCAAGVVAQCDFVHRAVVRVLDYLDGSTYVKQDVPPSDTTVSINPTIARVALLEFDPVNQQPPGYLSHIGTHLDELANSPGVTPQQHTLAIRIDQATKNVQVWLEAVRADAKKLVNMNDSQLAQPAALVLLDDMLKQAQTALAGQFDPNTSTVREGVAQIHNNIQGLATFDVAPCTINNGANSCS